MFQLFKKRTFSDYISDTFTFFKENGKHFLTHYFIINGVLLLVLLTLSYFLFKVYFEVLFSNIGTNVPNFLEDYFNNNIGLIVGVFLFFIIVLLFVSLISYSYPIVYLQLFAKKKGANFDTREIIQLLKAKLGKMVIFFLVLIGLSFTVGFVVLALIFALMFVVIGIPLAIILVPALLALIQISFYDYLNEEIGVFEALGRGFAKLKQNFWPITGSTTVMYVIIQTVSTIFIAIPYIFGMIQLFTDVQSQGSPSAETFSVFGIMMVIVMCISILASFILNNVLIVNSGIIYYSLKDENEDISILSDIDLIGKADE
jgi:hypothetical protein